MQRETTKSKVLKKVLCYLPVVICMTVIFWLSSRTADESARQSGAVLEWLIGFFGDNGFTDFIVRKSAHCLEFTGLSVLFNISLLIDRKKFMPVMSAVLTSAYAITDEFHQLFVPGRSCQISDWAIDTCGAIAGSLAFALIYIVALRISVKRKTKSNIDRENN